MPAARLSQDRREEWQRDGYFVVRNALTANQVDSLLVEVDRAYENHLTRKGRGGLAEGVELANIVDRRGPFVELIDLPATFGLVVDLLGPYIQLGLAATTIRPQNPTGKGFIHTDGGQALQRIHPTDDSWPLQVKVHYFLTDTSELGMGNFCVVPGSQRTFPTWPLGGELPAGEVPAAVQLRLHAGDAAFFSHALWHGAIGNASATTRKTVTFGYNQLFVRCMDYVHASPELLSECTPRQRRLLGDMGPDPNPITPGDYRFFYVPRDQTEIIEGA
jgi:ectoine hydroxylase-related dioxygenase (phytanoyl-CoA dioxygenase family)